jgi:hypothetical protein
LDEALFEAQDSEATELMSGIDDSGDDNDDEWVASSSEDGDDNGPDTVEPPKKKLKKDYPTCERLCPWYLFVPVNINL